MFVCYVSSRSCCGAFFELCGLFNIVQDNAMYACMLNCIVGVIPVRIGFNVFFYFLFFCLVWCCSVRLVLVWFCLVACCCFLFVLPLFAWFFLPFLGCLAVFACFVLFLFIFLLYVLLLFSFVFFPFMFNSSCHFTFIVCFLLSDYQQIA